jgi:hypothetical protein
MQMRRQDRHTGICRDETVRGSKSDIWMIAFAT